MATHSSILAWRIPLTEGPGRLLSLGSQKVRHDWSDLAHTLAKHIVSFCCFPRASNGASHKAGAGSYLRTGVLCTSVVRSCPSERGSVTCGPQGLPVALLQLQGSVQNHRDGITNGTHPSSQPCAVPPVGWGLKAGGGPAYYPPTPWVGQLLGPRCAERNGVSETCGASLSSGRTFEAPDTITYWPATHHQQRLGNHSQASCPTALETVVRWCRTRSFSSIILNVEKILFLWLCKLPFDFIQKKKKATVEFKHNVTCDDAQGKIEIFLKRRYNLSSS